MNSTKTKNRSKGQSMAEFALALPILLFVVFGLLEVGRAVFMYAAITNASREAVRYATAFGENDSYVLHYHNCAEIRETARRVAFLMPLEDKDIRIYKDTGPGTTQEEVCIPPATTDNSFTLECADRIEVRVTYDYSPIVPFVPQLTSHVFTSTSARTFLGVVELTNTAPVCN